VGTLIYPDPTDDTSPLIPENFFTSNSLMSSLKGLVGGAQKLAETFFGFRTFDLFRLVLELSAAGSSNG
jgi:hypothetical protein